MIQAGFRGGRAVKHASSVIRDSTPSPNKRCFFFVKSFFGRPTRQWTQILKGRASRKTLLFGQNFPKKPKKGIFDVLSKCSEHPRSDPDLVLYTKKKKNIAHHTKQWIIFFETTKAEVRGSIRGWLRLREEIARAKSLSQVEIFQACKDNSEKPN